MRCALLHACDMADPCNMPSSCECEVSPLPQPPCNECSNQDTYSVSEILRKIAETIGDFTPSSEASHTLSSECGCTAPAPVSVVTVPVQVKTAPEPTINSKVKVASDTAPAPEAKSIEANKEEEKKAEAPKTEETKPKAASSDGKAATEKLPVEKDIITNTGAVKHVFKISPDGKITKKE